MKALFEDHLNLAGKVMDMHLKRQNVVMSNIANINTPRYKPMELEFEKELQASLGLDAKGKLTRTNARHMPSAFSPESFDAEWTKQFKPRTVYGEDRVNMDKEMTKLGKNQLAYNTLATVIRSNFDGLKNVITEGQK